MYVQEVCNWYTMIYSIQVPHRNKCTGASLVLVCIKNTLYCVPLGIAICVQVNTCTSSVQLVHNELQGRYQNTNSQNTNDHNTN